MSQTLKLESMQALMDAALAGKSWKELEAMYADLKRTRRIAVADPRAADRGTCEVVGRHVEARAPELEPSSSFDAGGRYVATDEDMPF